MPYATGQRAANTIGAGPVGLPFSRRARHARRTTRAERRRAAQVKADAELARVEARKVRMANQAAAIEAAILAGHAEIDNRMTADTAVIPRVTDYGDPPRLTRPYLRERRPEVLRHMQAHRTQ